MDSSTMMDLTSKSQNAQLRHAKILQELEVKRRMNTVVVPTLLQDVIDKLREIGHPITLFGEKPEDRLRRLKFVVATREVEDEEAGVVRDMVSSKDSPSLERRLQEQQQQQQQQKKKRFYTPASSSLQNARKDIASYSFERSQKRLKGINEDRDDLKKYRVNQEYAVSLYNTLNNLLMTASQIGDHRPLTSCSFSKDDNSKYLATSSWSGLVKLWDRTVLDDANDEEEKRDSKDMCKLTYRGHDSRVQFVDFHPHSCCSDKGAPSAKSANLATASVDSTAKLWSLESSDALLTLKGHKARLCKVKWHPMGRHLGTTSFDKTWRLWDTETGSELQLQEGHSSETYGMAFHPDGSLVATGDLGGIGIVWDLRSGKSIFTMRKHSRCILSADWSPDGHTLATASDDHTVRIWDLRKQSCVYTLAAHSAMITTVKFAPRSGEFILTSSHDKTCKLWNTRDFKLLAEMAGHDGHVMGADITSDEKHFATASHDRSWKFWAHESEF